MQKISYKKYKITKSELFSHFNNYSLFIKNIIIELSQIKRKTENTILNINKILYVMQYIWFILNNKM